MFKRISTRLIGVTLPIVILTLFLVTEVSYRMSSRDIQDVTDQRINAELSTCVEAMNAKVQKLVAESFDAANMYLALYKTKDTEELMKRIAQMVEQDEMIIGIAIMTEPYTYDEKEELFLPYIYLEGGQVQTMMYEGFQYNEADYYKEVKSTGEVNYQKVYVDNTIGTLMTSIAVPIYDENKNFLGIINTDVDMSSIHGIMSEVQVGRTGRAIVWDKNGKYIYSQDADKIMNVQIGADEREISEEFTEDVKDDFDEHAPMILGNKNGSMEVMDNKVKHKAYFQKVDGWDWTVAISIEKAEIMEKANKFKNIDLIAGLVGVLVCTLAVWLQARYIARGLASVKEFSYSLADGDFSVEQLNIRTKDELAQMSKAMNAMLETNRETIGAIANSSQVVNTNSEIFKNSVEKLSQEFDEIDSSIRKIISSTMDNSAATEELNAAISDVNESINQLSSRANEGDRMVNEIKDRAASLESESKESSEQAKSLVNQYTVKLTNSIEESKVVNEIGTMAGAISDIAEQINLLSLNASIEAARAGEHGKGFSVVASEIGTLANQTAETVNNIKGLVDKVGAAVKNLADDSKDMLGFLETKVASDYDSFVDTARQYGMDAEDIRKLVEYLSDMSMSLENTINEVSVTIGTISESSQLATQAGSSIGESITEVGEYVKEVEEKAGEQQKLSSTLDGLVNRFKL